MKRKHDLENELQALMLKEGELTLPFIEKLIRVDISDESAYLVAQYLAKPTVNLIVPTFAKPELKVKADQDMAMLLSWLKRRGYNFTLVEENRSYVRLYTFKAQQPLVLIKRREHAT